MSKYVEVSALKKAIIENAQDLRTLSTKTVGQAISSLPTIEIVHCRDCKHYVSDGGAIMECEIYEVPTEDNHYCSYGERIDNE